MDKNVLKTLIILLIILLTILIYGTIKGNKIKKNKEIELNEDINNFEIMLNEYNKNF